MAGDTPITLVGNLVDDPVLRTTSAGIAVASFRVASTSRVFDRATGQWRDGETVFLTCSAWRQQAENVVATCRRGTRVMVQGRLRQRAWVDEQGRRRTTVDVDADEVGASLRHASGQLVRNRDGGSPDRGGLPRPADPPTPWGQQIGARAHPTPPASPVGDGVGPADGGDVWAPAGYASQPWVPYPPLEPGDDPPF